MEKPLFRLIAKKYSPAEQRVWHYNLLSMAGGDYPDAILPAEIKGLVDSVEYYAKRKRLTKKSTRRL